MPDHSSPTEQVEDHAPAPAPARLVSALPPGATLSPLGEALERGRMATQLPTVHFLAEHSLNLRTWWRLLFGMTTANGSPPQAATVIRYARAAGVDDSTALTLADQTFRAVSSPERLTKLGEELESRRIATGLPTRTFLVERGLTASTWYRLLHARDDAPTRTTVAKYAHAVGLDTDEALRLFQQDCRSRLSAARSAPPE